MKKIGLFILSSVILFGFIRFSIVQTEFGASPGCVTITVLFKDHCPVVGAFIKVFNAESFDLGYTDNNGQQEACGVIPPGEYVAKAYYPDTATLFASAIFTVDENGDGSCTLVGSYEITPPVIEILSPQNVTYTNSSIPLTFTIYDYSSISWMGYSLDGQANVTVTGNTTLSGLSYGCHKIVVHANDTFGNMEASSTIFFSMPHLVPDDYSTIQEAINNANEGDTIFVKNGTYYEHLTINKTLTLVGENREATIIDGSDEGNVTRVTADNVTIMGFTIRNGGATYCGILIELQNNTNIQDNNIINNLYGIGLWASSGNIISGNNITNNYNGIRVKHYSHNNTITENNIENNEYGIWTWWSENNRFYHNNFVNNAHQVHIQESGYANSWDNDYPSGGNYWSNYSGTDLYSGPYQNETGSDGLGDSPYVIDEDNQDRYPLISSWPPHDVAVFDISLSTTEVYAGQIVNIAVTLKNHGIFTETFDVSTYYDSILIGTQTVTNLPQHAETILTFSWNTTGIAEGCYTISANASVVPGETHTTDNTFIDGTIKVMSPLRIVEVIPCNQTGYPKQAFELGTISYFKVTINNTAPTLSALITINLYDNATITIGVASFQGPILQGTSTIIFGLPIPTAAATGTATVYANAYTDWPHLGGFPHCPEKSATLEITEP